jgi:hypothetical protein
MAQQSDLKLKELLSKQDYFALNEQYPLLKKYASKQYQLFTESYLNYFFNKPTESNENIRQLFNQYSNWLSSEYQIPFSFLAAENEMKMQNYNKTASIYAQLIEQINPYDDSVFFSSFVNAHKLYASLADVPRMEVVYSQKQTKIPLNDISWGLLTLNVYTGENYTDTLHFTLDFGASFSMIEEKYAEVLKIKILADSILIANIHGSNKYAKIGVANELNLGEIQLKNVIFLVSSDRIIDIYPDDEMYALLGINVLQLLENLQFTKSTLLISPSPKRAKTVPNMLISQTSLFIHAKTPNTSLNLHFDSGRNSSFLNKNYLSKSREDTANLTIDTGFVAIGYGSEYQKLKMFRKTDFVFQIDNKAISFPSIYIEMGNNLPNNMIPSDGVLGVDVITNHKKVTIDFKHMYFMVK